MSPGERYGRVYQINYLRCIFCGLCIEACPTRALTMSNEYELADDNRADLIFEKKDLLAPLLGGMLAPPHAMVPGTTERDYYQGRVTQAVPEQHPSTDLDPAVLEADPFGPHAPQAATDAATEAAADEATGTAGAAAGGADPDLTAGVDGDAR